MTRERLTKPVVPLQRAPDATPKTRASSRPVQLARLPRTLEAKPVSSAQFEIQRTQQLEVQRLANLEVQRASIQRAHDDRYTQARASQTAWHARGTKTIGVQRVELQVCPALPIVQRQAELTLPHVAAHLGSQAAVQLARDPDRLSSYAGFKNAGAGLVKNFRTPGSSHTMPELASAIQRFRDPMQRAAVEGAVYAAFGSHPTYPKQLQRALEERDSNLEVQREAWQRELELVAQRQALEEASGEGAAGMIEASRGSGQPLPAGVRAMLETRWNTDLSKVRVHTDSRSSQISKKLNAKALTTGQDIFFGAGTFNPTSLEGLQLIAHEAWHTVQQAGGLVQAGIDRSRSLEVEARGKGAELSSGDVQTASSATGLKAKGVSNHTPNPSRTVQRLELPIQRDNASFDQSVKALLSALAKADLKEVARILGGLTPTARTKALQEAMKLGTAAVRARAEGILASLGDKVIKLSEALIERYKGQTIKSGTWKPPGGQDPSYYVGNEAHKRITEFYREKHPEGDIGKDVFFNNFPMKSIIDKSLFTKAASKLSPSELNLKPDIYNSINGDLYEIKPVGSINLALTEAFMYLNLFKKAGIPAQLGSSNDPGVSGIVQAPSGHYVFMSPLPGVIIYQLRRGDYNPQPVPITVPAPSLKPKEQTDADFMKEMERITGLTGAALIIYLIISEGSRIIPPRNLIPIP